jgi:hypothetical protein
MRVMPEWSYQVDGSMVVWDFREWTEPDQHEVVEVMETFEEVTVREEVTASVTMLADGGNIDRETFETIDAYIDVYDRNDVEKVAFVSPDIKGLALKGEIKDAPGVEVEAFEDESEARAWAQQ